MDGQRKKRAGEREKEREKRGTRWNMGPFCISLVQGAMEIAHAHLNQLLPPLGSSPIFFVHSHPYPRRRGSTAQAAGYHQRWSKPFFVAHPSRVLFLTCVSFFLSAVCLSNWLHGSPPRPCCMSLATPRTPSPAPSSPTTRIATPWACTCTPARLGRERKALETG